MSLSDWLKQNTDPTPAKLTTRDLKRTFRAIENQCPECLSVRVSQTGDATDRRPLWCRSCGHRWSGHVYRHDF